MATIANTRNGSYYIDIPNDDAQAICDLWNEGLARKEWRVASWEDSTS